MKSTPLRGYPVPECEPPLVKDASDIIQIKNLADAIDADVEALTNEANPLIFPVAGKMNITGLVMGVTEFVVPYNNISWVTRSDMADIDTGVMVIPESGFYQWHLWAGVDSATNAQMRLRLMVNDFPTGVWGGFSTSVATVTTQSSTHDVSLFLSAGDRVTTQVRHNLAGSNTFHSAIHLLQLARS